MTKYHTEQDDCGGYQNERAQEESLSEGGRDDREIVREDQHKEQQ